jgi:hypothetical protein
LISAMLSVLSNREHLSRFGTAANTEINANYSHRRMVHDYAELYYGLRK